MGKGRVYRDRPFRYRDRHSGREVRRLTDYLGHSSHLYFTDNGWCNGGRSLIFTSDRENQSNLFRYDLDTATITQLTDLHGPGRPSGSYSAATGGTTTGGRASPTSWTPTRSRSARSARPRRG
jgi:oligogalacturonide lyase